MEDFKPFLDHDKQQRQVDVYTILNFMAAEKHLKSLRMEDPNPMNAIVMPDPSVLSLDQRGPLSYDKALELQFRRSLFPPQPHSNPELYQRIFMRSLETLRLMQNQQKFAEALKNCAKTGEPLCPKLPELLVPRKSEVPRMEATAKEAANNGAQRRKIKSSKMKMGAIEDSQESQSSKYVYAPILARGRKPGPKPDKTFTCLLCSRSFGYKHVLQNHLRTHTGEKPYGCTVCDKRFTRDHHLKTHFRLHTGERPHKCEYCDRKFVQVANLRRHHRVHTGEKPYKCCDCEAAFPDKNQLRTHSATHEATNTCHTCKTIFRSREDFRIHECQGEPSDTSSSSENDYRYANDELLPRTRFTNRTIEEFTGRSRTASPESSADSSDSQMPSSPMEGVSAPQLSPKDVVPVQTEPEDLSLNNSPMNE